MIGSLAVEIAIVTLLAGVSQFVASHLALLPARGLRPDSHWSEHARRKWNARMLINLGPAILLGAFLAKTARHLHGAEDILRVLLVPICAAFGAMIGGLPAARKASPRPLGLRDLLSDYAISFLVLSPSTIFMLAMLCLLYPRHLDARSIAIMACGFLIPVLLPFGLMPVLRALGLLTQAPERLTRIVREAAETADIAPPEVALLRWRQANAFAFPFARTIAFTGAALELLSDEELRAVALHEIAHLQETVAHRLTRLSGILVIFPVFTFPVWQNEYGAPGMLIPFAIFLFGRRLLTRFSQKMEKRADEAAATGSSEFGTCYATALEKIYEFNLVPAVMRGRAASHPHLYDRLIAAGLQPSYPRPKPPTLFPTLACLLVLVGGTMISAEYVSRHMEEASPAYNDDAEPPSDSEEI